MRDAFTVAERFFTRTGDLWLAASAIALAIYFFSGYFTTLRFDRERIEIRVASGRIQVQGLYHYTNTSRLPAVLTLRVPFPVDNEHPQPETYSLYEASADGRALAEIPLIVRGDDIRFRLLFRPGEGKWVRLDYIQPTHVRNGRYLLTTTRPWRRPIGLAAYVLHLPQDFELTSSNYPLGDSHVAGHEKVYRFSRKDFFPVEDWEFAWSEPAVRAARLNGVRP